MKKYNFLIAVCVLLSTATTLAGNTGVGGGDGCENRIKIIRDDLKSWIQRGGPQYLKFPSGISADQYSKVMIEQIDTATVKCVGKGDEGYPVNVNGTPKVCRFDLLNQVGQITCDFEKFESQSEADQYMLIHHEYAGLSGIEIPNGADSDYTLSNQITAYLESTMVKKLAVKPPAEGFDFDSIKVELLPKDTFISFKLEKDIIVLPYQTSVSLCEKGQVDPNWKTLWTAITAYFSSSENIRIIRKGQKVVFNIQSSPRRLTSPGSQIESVIQYSTQGGAIIPNITAITDIRFYRNCIFKGYYEDNNFCSLTVGELKDLIRTSCIEGEVNFPTAVDFTANGFNP